MNTYLQKRGLLKVICISLLLVTAKSWASDDFLEWGLPLIEKDGKPQLVRLSDYRGKVVYVDFWASWCRPCLVSMPFLNGLRNEFRERGFEVVAVNVDQRIEDAEAFLDQHPVDYPVVGDVDNRLFTHLQVTGLPTGFLLNASGEIVLTHRGFKPSDKPFIKAVIDRELAYIED